MTSDRLSLMVLRPGVGLQSGRRHRAGRNPQRGPLTQFGGPVADEPVDHLVGFGGFDADLDTAVADRAGGLVVFVGQRLNLPGDRRIGDDRDGELAVHAAGGGGFAAVGQRVTEEAPQDDRAHHHDDGDQRGDDADTDATPAAGHGAVAARPFAAFPIAAVLRARRRRWRRSGRRSRRTGVAELRRRVVALGELGPAVICVAAVLGLGVVGLRKLGPRYSGCS